jgi:hypothetical protein
LSIWLVKPTPAVGSQTFDIGFDLMYFDYSEYNSNNILLDQETGVLPGLAASWRYQWPQWFVTVDLDYHEGNVDYEGQTQSGTPLATTTGTYVTNLRFMGGRTFSGIAGTESSLYAGAGYHYWYRDINPGADVIGTPVAGLLEIYQWTFAILGTELGLVDTPTTRLALDIRAKYLMRGTMDIDFQGFLGFDNTQVNLGTDWSFRLGIPLTFALNKTSRLVIEPYYDTWDIPKSNVVELTRNGVPTGIGVLEPRSETRNIGISFLYRAHF